MAGQQQLLTAATCDNDIQENVLIFLINIVLF